VHHHILNRLRGGAVGAAVGDAPGVPLSSADSFDAAVAPEASLGDDVDTAGATGDTLAFSSLVIA